MIITHRKSPAPEGADEDLRAAARMADIWILQQCKDMQEGATRHSVRSLIAAAQKVGLKAALVHPRWVEIRASDEARDGGGLTIDGVPTRPPIAAISRSGVKLSRRGRRVLTALEALGVLCIPSVAAFNGARDKLICARRLRAAGVPTPETVEVADGVDARAVERALGFPVVIKNAVGSKGEQVRLCRRKRDFDDVVASVTGKGPVIAQRFVSESRGRDVRAFVVGGELVASMLRRLSDEADPAEFRTNIALGGVGQAFVPCDALRKTAEAAARALRLEIAGVDLLFDRDGFSVCEVNMSPSLSAIEMITGVAISEKIMRRIINITSTSPLYAKTAPILKERQVAKVW